MLHAQVSGGIIQRVSVLVVNILPIALAHLACLLHLATGGIAHIALFDLLRAGMIIVVF